MPKTCLPLFALLLPCLAAPAQVKLAAPFQSHMVVQRDITAPVWGTATKGERVTVKFRGQTVSTTTASNGTWRIKLNKGAAGGPFVMTITGQNNKLTLTDVMVGDVWLCSGQSNMVWNLARTDNGATAINTAGQWGLRLWKVGSAWQAASSQTAPNFSAVAFYFGRAMAKRYKVPIGLIQGARGGTRISTWQVGAGNYKTYIAPTQGLAIRGALWYQGESDAQPALSGIYEDALRKLITDWRKIWGQGNFPFLWVQIAKFKTGRNPDWMKVQEAQAHALDLPDSAMACILDLPAPSIHPTRKLPVGQRLALAARAVAFGEKITHMGPLLDPARTVISSREIKIAFLNGSGLKSTGGAPNHFEIAGSDLRYVPASARISGSSVIVSSPQVSHPIAARYAWVPFPSINLFNGIGLPASPFRFLAQHARVGKGCGISPAPSLTGSTAPRIGRRFALGLSNLPPRRNGAMLVGASNQRWGKLTLPFDLSSIGMPGCKLHSSGEIQIGFTSSAAGKHQLAVTLPRTATLLGSSFHDQAFVITPGANPAGIVATNAGNGRVGY